MQPSSLGCRAIHPMLRNPFVFTTHYSTANQAYIVCHRTHCGTTRCHPQTESIQCTALSSEEDRVTATANMHRKIGELWPRGFRDMQIGRQTYTDCTKKSQPYFEALSFVISGVNGNKNMINATIKLQLFLLG